MSTDNPYEVLPVDDIPVVGPDGRFERCPRCQTQLEEGFVGGTGIGFLTIKSMSGWINLPKSIRPNATFWQRFWDSSKYFRAYLCNGCGCCIVDGSAVFGYSAARRIAKQRLGK